MEDVLGFSFAVGPVTHSTFNTPAQVVLSTLIPKAQMPHKSSFCAPGTSPHNSDEVLGTDPGGTHGLQSTALPGPFYGNTTAACFSRVAPFLTPLSTTYKAALELGHPQRDASRLGDFGISPREIPAQVDYQ